MMDKRLGQTMLPVPLVRRAAPGRLVQPLPVFARKVYQQNCSAAGAETHALLLSLFRTSELQGHEPLDFLRQITEAAIAGQPLELIRPAATAQAA